MKTNNDKPQIDVREKGFKNRPSIVQVIEKVFAKISPLGIEEINLREIPNHRLIILAEDVKAVYSVPNFSRSLMDGFAIQSSDLRSVSAENPVELAIIEEISIKEVPKNPIISGQTIKIPTGGVLPHGSDCVIPIEDVNLIEGNGQKKIKITIKMNSGDHISLKGEDAKKGEVLFRKGKMLSPINIGVLLSVGISSIKTFKIVNIGILSTGDEIVDEDRNLEPGEVYDSNSFMLMQYIRQLGFKVNRYKIIKDDYENIKAEILKIINQNDLLITTGGTSVGKKDFIPLILNDLSNVIVHGIAIRPGGPTTFGIGNNKYFLGLPGFPVSSLISFSFFGLPILFRLMGGDNLSFAKVKAYMAVDFNSSEGITEYLRVSIHYLDDRIIASPIRVSGSSLLKTLSQSDGIVVIDPVVTKIEKDSVVDVLFLDKLVDYLSN